MEVLHQDAIDFLKSTTRKYNVVTSPPDHSEIIPEMMFEQWSSWFEDAVLLTLQTVPRDGYGIIAVTDRRNQGRIYSKAHVVMDAATALNMHVVWHKIILNQKVGTVGAFKPAYSHLICVSREGKSGHNNKEFPDVMDGCDAKGIHGMSYEVTLAVCRFLSKQAPSHTILDPFCGKGTTLLAARKVGMEALGIDASKTQVEAAERALAR